MNNKAAIYCRISVYDEKKNSIKNQKNILLDYAKKENIDIFDIYIDKGYSGTNFERPEFKRMYDDIKNNLIDTIIVKDLSRLGRDYLEVGYFVEKIFPIYNIRLISVNDNLDTSTSFERLTFAIKNIINEYYALDISNKIKSTLNNQMKNCIYKKTRFPLYGYKFGINNERIINHETAINVKNIFNMFNKGMSIYEIANKLNEDKILSPSSYNINAKTKWNRQSLLNIIKNKEYTGYYIRHKTIKKFKSKKRIMVNKEDSFIIKNDDLKIIDIRLYNKCQKRLKELYKNE